MKFAKELCISVAAGALFSMAGVASAQTVSLGAVLPLTGASASVGDDQRRGVELAVEQVNAHNGVLGQKLQVIVEDSGGAAATALSSARKLVSVNKVPVVIGEFSSGITIPVGEYVVQQGDVHINIGSSSPQVRKIGSGSFSVIGLDDLSARFAAGDVFGQSLKDVAFIAPNNSYGQGVANEFKKRFEALGGKVSSVILYSEGQSTYRRELQQMSRSAPQAYVYSAYGQEAATINREAFELGLNKKKWYGIYLTMCTSDTTPQAAQGQEGLEVASIGDGGKSYEQAYRAKYKEAPKSSFGSYAYDGVMVAVAAINKAGSADPAKIRTAMKALGPYNGATGTIAFDDAGQRKDQPYDKVKFDSKVVSR
ncbi:Leucine-, isoleucine-, valine-, threonine-, and alanine-binding protein [Paraburkholderia hiiakae]|uniref:Leucine-, isoleucine-, valine-, threonine-, and alanine-binding protein n=1 Tax=Paraburkholderia hiiakae TaxID=1081782 RepID=A0ABM8NZ54_9BURK|nr:ABC transporter substrate-binding protein [Paraburkholderia hiiakae]CAD6550295.1 Leucine-, isoleucine-, valine-, threonine-, and alanine-binding protein [Paraburkholderia hiiakae]